MRGFERDGPEACAGVVERIREVINISAEQPRAMARMRSKVLQANGRHRISLTLYENSRSLKNS